MKKVNMDLVVGGSILIALFILIAGVLWLKEISVTRRMVQYTVSFSNIGSLQIGDPVMVNGVRMGSVATAELKGSKVAVTIDLEKKVVMTDSAIITVQNIGLMGERCVGIQLSDKGTAIKPNNRKTGEVALLDGYFDSGIAEAMGMLGTVLGEVEVLVKNVQAVVDQTVGDTAFIAVFNGMIGRLDTIAQLVESLVVDNKDELDRTLANVHALSADVRRLLDHNENSINQLVANGVELSGRAVNIVTEIESVAVSVKSMVDAVARGEGALGMLVEDERIIEDIRRAVTQLDTLVDDVKEDGLRLRIKFGFRDRKKKN